jgi:hypothetical protein
MVCVGFSDGARVGNFRNDLYAIHTEGKRQAFGAAVQSEKVAGLLISQKIPNGGASLIRLAPWGSKA